MRDGVVLRADVYRPHTSDPVPVILQHPVVAQRLTKYCFEFEDQTPRQSVVARARLEHHNRSCPKCRRVAVRLMELDDALLDRRGLEIHGTATIIGFYCTACRHEWAPRRLNVVTE